ncbi:hypothetical protein [Streptomyces sp. NPDC048361]|uniref:hypothetical protein n=1 Tax=Streptomyces sp. NPDC048361 TaxID=3154720 RepID=UPI003432C8FE
MDSQEWTDPRYAELVEDWRRAQPYRSPARDWRRTQNEQLPAVRGFLVPKSEA